MSQRRNKNKSGRRKNGKGDNSPPSEAVSDVSPSERNFGDEAQSEGIIEREFVESGDANVEAPNPAQAFEGAAASESTALYNELVQSPEEPVSMESKVTADTEAVQGASDTESTLPRGIDNPNGASDGGEGFFQSFFACCVGRK
jgi:hypothetical protein